MQVYINVNFRNKIVTTFPLYLFIGICGLLNHLDVCNINWRIVPNGVLLNDA